MVMLSRTAVLQGSRASDKIGKDGAIVILGYG